MKSVLRKWGMALSFVALASSVIPAAMANCPTFVQGDAAKYLAIYNEIPISIGTSWRLMIRPRNDACLMATGNWVMSPVTSGNANAVGVNDGAHNCSDKHKSFIALPIPAAATVYDTYMVKNADGVVTQQGTTIGWKVNTSKGGGYQGLAVVLPMQLSDGTPDKNNSYVAGICFL